MEKEFTWEIKVKNTPLVKKKCNHCSSDRFYCSEKFRMNSQKRNTDVWLIYRCVKCDSTYNMTILSRTKPELISKDLFTAFSENNATVAWKYAFSADNAQKNKVELDFDSVEYDINHDMDSIENILSLDCSMVKFKVKCPFELNLKLSTVIRTCLSVSANLLNRMIEANAVFTAGKRPVKKHKVKDGDIIWIDKEKLKKLIPVFRPQTDAERV